MNDITNKATATGKHLNKAETRVKNEMPKPQPIVCRPL